MKLSETVEILSGISKVQNNLATCLISNNSDENITLCYKRPVDSKPISSYEISNSSSESIIKRRRRKFNKTRLAREINSFQTQPAFNSSLLHTKAEEKEMVINVTTEFQDVFYIESQPLPTSKTSDDIPVHTNTYHYPFAKRSTNR